MNTASKTSNLNPSRGKKVQSVETIEPTLSENESDTSETADDDNIEEGMEKLIKALGEDGLNQFDLAQLHTLTGTVASDEEGDGEHERSSVELEDAEQDGEEGESSGAEDVALDDEDIDSVDEDAVPVRKIEIDNKACHEFSFLAIASNIVTWTWI